MKPKFKENQKVRSVTTGFIGKVIAVAHYFTTGITDYLVQPECGDDTSTWPEAHWISEGTLEGADGKASKDAGKKTPAKTPAKKKPAAEEDDLDDLDDLDGGDDDLDGLDDLDGGDGDDDLDGLDDLDGDDEGDREEKEKALNKLLVKLAKSPTQVQKSKTNKELCYAVLKKHGAGSVAELDSDKFDAVETLIKKYLTKAK